MKALVRNKGEKILETDNISYIDWNTGAPLTDPQWSGGPYTLIADYHEPIPEVVEDSE